MDKKSKFIDELFLCGGGAAFFLYNQIKSLPIIDYHSHLDAREIYEDKVFSSLTEAWLSGDHYKWRAMRAMGIEEKYITGAAEPYEKFFAYAKILPYLAGNPLYHFSHLELFNYFGIDAPLNESTAKYIYEKTGKALQKLSVREILKKSGVEVIVTTNDPLDDLVHHKLLRDENFAVKVLPAFRPDKAINIESPDFLPYLEKLSSFTGINVASVQEMKEALKKRLEYFISYGCPAADHGMTALPEAIEDEILADGAIKKILSGERISNIEICAYKTAILKGLFAEYAAKDIVAEIHFGVLRNASDLSFYKLGRDSGFDTVNGRTGIENLQALLNSFEKSGLPKTIIFSLNPSDNAVIASAAGSFQREGVKGYVQQGAAWWFNDSKKGIEEQLSTYASIAPLDTFVGMLTDSRSFLSFARHDYFRRVLANYLGNLADNGEYSGAELGALAETARNISYFNAKKYFGLEPKPEIIVKNEETKIETPKAEG
jgi:Glucuronate isomerase